MYFTKKYWKIIIYIYKLNYINTNLILNLNKESSSCIPSIFKNIGYIFLHNGKVNKKYYLNKTSFCIKNLL